jgi:hypothetical protein
MFCQSLTSGALMVFFSVIYHRQPDSTTVKSAMTLKKKAIGIGPRAGADSAGCYE